MNHEEKVNTILNYHNETKHHFNRYARSLGYMDWENQPNPFRIFQDCDTFHLPFKTNYQHQPHQHLFFRNKNETRPFSFESISEMIENSMALSAWKQVHQDKWSLRINPSSGNLHPTESYWILPQLDGLNAGVYHYNPLLHNLSCRCRYEKAHTESWKDHFGTDGFFVALSSIFWREAWKYGERAFRYCNHDIGHAIAALSFSANLLGWSLHYIDTTDHELAALLGFNQTQWHAEEKEKPDLLCWVTPNGKILKTRTCPHELLQISKTRTFYGIPNLLSDEHQQWEIIEHVSLACQKEKHDLKNTHFPDVAPLMLPASAKTAQQLIQQRRSAVSFQQRKSTISYDHFMGILSSTLPRDNMAPFDCKPGTPQTHLLLFVHDVVDLDSGLYLFLRSPDDLEPLKTLTHKKFLWKEVHQKLPLYLLESGDYRQEAQLLSCQQEIAGESAFSLGMLSHFETPITEHPHRYKHLFWESGMIGQVLYLQAEAYGLRGTGIGCFFDDPVHELLGLKDQQYQILYHFTIGFPVDDERLSTLPAYHHLS